MRQITTARHIQYPEWASGLRPRVRQPDDRVRVLCCRIILVRGRHQNEVYSQLQAIQELLAVSASRSLSMFTIRVISFYFFLSMSSHNHREVFVLMSDSA
jgi:hypothetical protein